jgi:hypothetical protein
MIFPVQLPVKDALLNIQIWDLDFFSTNDCLADTVLDLSAACKRCADVARVHMVLLCVSLACFAACIALVKA